MEFGVFINGYLPGPASRDTDAEHLMLEREIEIAVTADRYNWKYAWFGEHHALTEYSHMSAPEPVMGWVAPGPSGSTSARPSTACRPARSTPSGTPSGPP